MQKTIKNLILSGVVAAMPAFTLGVTYAADMGSNNPGYVFDSSGKNVLDSQGKCVRTGSWKPEYASVECGDAVKAAEPAPAPEPAAGPAPAAVPKTTFQAETLFDFDKATLKADGKAQLDDLVTKLKDHPEVEVVMAEGYTDRIGSEAYNMKLSQRRVDAVKKYMVSKGVDANRIQAVAKGEADPVVSCDDVKGKENRRNTALIKCLAPNRRVEVQVEVQKEMQQ
ncbi:MAG TPA: OmpA family protein [Gammaproteobacteria bacterium]|nr:OmpA family protein [Gammaproteobacteria bacterium]